jgi:hypothetical protein
MRCDEKSLGAMPDREMIVTKEEMPYCLSATTFHEFHRKLTKPVDRLMQDTGRLKSRAAPNSNQRCRHSVTMLTPQPWREPQNKLGPFKLG